MTIGLRVTIEATEEENAGGPMFSNDIPKTPTWALGVVLTMVRRELDERERLIILMREHDRRKQKGGSS